MTAYRGLIVRPSPDFLDFEIIQDGFVSLDANGVIECVADISRQLQFEPLPDELSEPSQLAILPGCVNTHDHSFQPPAIPGVLIEPCGTGFQGWLPTTLQEGEFVAKAQPDKARRMIRSRLNAFAANGITTILEHTTSSIDAARTVLEEAEQLGLRVMVGYVAMNQCIEAIQTGLEALPERILAHTRSLLDEYGPERVCVIDRASIAVTSPLRRSLAILAREYGALYETHCDESIAEKSIHQSLYGSSSIIQTLRADGVFEPGSRVGLAHAIHTTEAEITQVAEQIARGCDVSIRACPNSNAQLRSHWDGQNYVRFPLEHWQQAGATITFGTDQGAGRLANLFSESYWERARQPQEIPPLHLLQMITLNGLRTLRLHTRDLCIQAGNRADFIVVELKGADGFYDHTGPDLERNIARILEGGMEASAIRAVYVKGRQIKSDVVF